MMPKKRACPKSGSQPEIDFSTACRFAAASTIRGEKRVSLTIRIATAMATVWTNESRNNFL
jgi:hypothetical protein